VAILVTISTVTTGWHYGVDVIGGLLLAAITTLLANTLLASEDSLRIESGTEPSRVFVETKAKS
jgi:membrane-associated phospholipid phosphatase